MSVSASVSSGDLSSVTWAKEEAAESKKPRVERSTALGTYRRPQRALKARLNAGANLISVS